MPKNLFSEVQTNQIMVIDDNPETLKLFTELLESSGYTVRPSDSGELASMGVLVSSPFP